MSRLNFVRKVVETIISARAVKYVRPVNAVPDVIQEIVSMVNCVKMVPALLVAAII